MKKLLLLVLLLSLSLPLAGCDNDNANAQGDNIQADLLVDIVSGSVSENPEGEGFILEVEVSPVTVFIEDRPGLRSGAITTEAILENFNSVFNEGPPNAIFSLVEGEVRVAVPVTLISADFDAAESTAEFLVTPMDEAATVNSPPGTSLELTDISDLASPFGQALLFIDETGPCGTTNPDCPFNTI